MALCMHYHALLIGTVWKCEVAYYTDWKKALPQRELGKKAVTKCAFHAGKMIF